MKVVIIHGTMGSSEGNWFPWLKKELEKLGHNVFVPQFPTPGNQSPESWCQTLQNKVPFTFDNETILIGHSLGANYILHILDRERKEKIKKAILVSGFNNLLGNEMFDNLNKPFIKDFNWKRIKNNVEKISLFHGKNDPYIPMSEALELEKNLNTKLNIIENGGHLNADSGFFKFNEILKETTEYE